MLHYFFNIKKCKQVWNWLIPVPALCTLFLYPYLTLFPNQVPAYIVFVKCKLSQFDYQKNKKLMGMSIN
jgi:hypothetical protein